MTSISLLIPTGFGPEDERRIDIFNWVLARWMMQFSGTDWQVCLGTDNGEEFNRSRARNAAFQQSDGDILVLSDADTITTPANVLAAIDIVKKTGAWVIAHEYYYSVCEIYTDFILAHRPDFDLGDGSFHRTKIDWVMHNQSVAGVLVMPREAYESVEGHDERFKGWGYEDSAFAAKLDRVWGTAQRTSGHIAHLWHPRGLDFDQPYIKENQALFERTRDDV